MTSIVVASAEKKTSKTGKPYMFFNDADGNPWTSWEAVAWPLIKPGAKFDIEWVQKGEYKNISSMVFRGETEPPPVPEPPINHEKQESIEGQNARTNLCLLFDHLTDEGISQMSLLQSSLVSQLCSLAGLHFDGSYKAKGGMVQAAIEQGAVVKPDRTAAEKLAKTITTLGKLRTEVAKFGAGYETQEEQEKKLGQKFDTVSDFAGAYIFAWEQRHG